MTDKVRSAKASSVRFVVWYLLMAVAVMLTAPWEAWFGQQLLPFAFTRFRDEFHGQPVRISLSDSASLRRIPVQINMTEGVCSASINGSFAFSMGAGSTTVKSTGAGTLVLDPGAGSGSYGVCLANQWYGRVRLLRWISACVMLLVLAYAGILFVIRWEKQLRTGHALATTDARQRPVSVLDPIRIHLLRQHNPIPTESLRQSAANSPRA